MDEMSFQIGSYTTPENNTYDFFQTLSGITFPKPPIPLSEPWFKEIYAELRNASFQIGSYTTPENNTYDFFQTLSGITFPKPPIPLSEPWFKEIYAELRNASQKYEELASEDIEKIEEPLGASLFNM